MDPLSISAGIITVLTATLQTGIAIHKVVSGIRKSPREVQEVAVALRDFNDVIEQLAALPNLQQGQQMEFPELRALIIACHNDIVSFDQKLSGIQLHGNDKVSRRAWKRVKACFSKKDFEDMASSLLRHTSILTLHLAVLQSNAGHEHSQCLKRLTNRFDQKVLVDVEARNQVEAMAAITNQALDSLRQRVDQIPEIIEKLQSQLLQDMSQQHEHPKAIPARSRQTSIGDHRNSEKGSIQRSINNLCRLVKVEEICASHEAQDMIGDMEDLLDSLLNETAHSGQSLRLDRAKRKFSEYQPDSNVKSLQQLHDSAAVIKRMKGLLSSAFNISLNKPVLPTRGPQYELPHSRKRHQQSQDFLDGTVVLRSCTKWTRPHESNIHKSELLEFSASVSFLRTKSSSPSKMTFKIWQQFQHGGIHSIHPLILVDNVLENKSRIFKVVTEGTLEEMMQMFHGGQASVRDCDENGDPLLTYACRGNRKDHCKYLLDHGADVDYQYRDKEGSFWSILMIRGPNEWEMNRCNELLVQAGADPLVLDLENWSISPLAFAVTMNDLDFVRSALNSQDFFIDIEERNAEGQTVLLQCLSETTKLSSWNESLDYLMSKKPNIRARDHEGNTCLHILLGSLFPAEDYLEILVSLIQAGAEVNSVNSKQQSVSQLASRQEFQVGSLAWDCWRTALYICGFDASSVCHGYWLDTQFCSYYTREDYVWLNDQIMTRAPQNLVWKLISERGYALQTPCGSNTPEESDTSPISSDLDSKESLPLRNRNYHGDGLLVCEDYEDDIQEVEQTDSTGYMTWKMEIAMEGLEHNPWYL